MLNQLKPLIQQQSKRKRGRKAKAKPIRPSRKLELDYTRALLAIVDDMHTETVKALMPLIEQPNIGDGKRIVNDGLFSDFKTAFSRVSLSIKNRVAGIADALAELVVSKQNAEVDKQLIDLIQKQTGLGLTGLAQDEAINEAIAVAKAAQVALIKSLPQQYLDKVEQAVLAGIQSGAGYFNEELDAALAKIESLTQNRAKLIARDQMGKINSRISQVRQESLGITHYTWVTMRDGAVRGAPNYFSFYNHNKRDNKVFAWDNPVGDGHPGQPINCRCLAIPYVGHLTGGLTGEEMMAKQPPISEII
mgnify:CR=1 FL=1